jgi:hypothetical protein
VSDVDDKSGLDRCKCAILVIDSLQFPDPLCLSEKSITKTLRFPISETIWKFLVAALDGAIRA